MLKKTDKKELDEALNKISAALGVNTTEYEEGREYMEADYSEREEHVAQTLADHIERMAFFASADNEMSQLAIMVSVFDQLARRILEMGYNVEDLIGSGTIAVAKLETSEAEKRS